MGCDLPARRLSKDERLNTWLFNRRLSGEWTSSPFRFGYNVYYFGHVIERKRTQRLRKTTRVSEDITNYNCFCGDCKVRLKFFSTMADPNRDQRNLKDETTDLWHRKRRAQQLILRKDHHLFEFYFILYDSGRWKKEE